MAKTAKRRGRKGSSISGFFRKLYEANPEWLEEKTNSDMVALWRMERGNRVTDKRLVQSLNNLKSVLRKDWREKGRTPKSSMAARAVMTVTVSSSKLDALEEAIDECLTEAKNVDRVGLSAVIKLLRRARNEVIWKLGIK